MIIERNFNKRTAPLVEVQPPTVRHGRGDALGVEVVFYPYPGKNPGQLRMHMAPAEAIAFGLELIAGGRDRLKAIGALD